jgi:2-polyprenyl-3-methyl-5-hydroxy-6-metoxy-1,4-benzoquinol methylase
MQNYLDVVYSKEKRPYTDYPSQMCKNLFDRFAMKKGDRLLDIGCGRGDFTKAFKDLGLQVAGIDREQGDSELLQGIDVRIQKDLENDAFPFEDNSFDVVFSKSVIEHVRTPDTFMKEQLRVLKPGGRLITMTPDWHTQMFIFYDDHTHVHPYTATGMKDLFAMSGLKNVQSELFYQLPVVWKYPVVKIVCKGLQLLGPVKKLYKNKFIRWSRELMILTSGVK